MNEELRRIGSNYPHSGMGLSMIGPALLEFGNDEQKREHLPKIVRGDIWWCQGYSEPGSGSDLASLQTKAVEDGDDYVINGSKIWTSGANFADWMFCLVRTDPECIPSTKASRSSCSTWTTPGVSVKPIKLISGMSPFCQTFLDDVRTPKKNVVGELNKGWTVGKRLLAVRALLDRRHGRQRQPRAGIRWPSWPNAMSARTSGMNRRCRRPAPDVIEHRITDMSPTASPCAAAARSCVRGKAPTFLSSMFKLYGTEQNKRRLDLSLAIMGNQMLGWEGDGFERTRTRYHPRVAAVEGEFH